MTYQGQMQQYRVKARRATNLHLVEYALKDIRETLEIWESQRVADVLVNGTAPPNPYINQLLAERDAYLERYAALRRTHRILSYCLTPGEHMFEVTADNYHTFLTFHGLDPETARYVVDNYANAESYSTMKSVQLWVDASRMVLAAAGAAA